MSETTYAPDLMLALLGTATFGGWGLAGATAITLARHSPVVREGVAAYVAPALADARRRLASLPAPRRPDDGDAPHAACAVACASPAPAVVSVAAPPKADPALERGRAILAAPLYDSNPDNARGPTIFAAKPRHGKSQAQIACMVEDIASGAETVWMSTHATLYHPQDQPVDLRPLGDRLDLVTRGGEIRDRLAHYVNDVMEERLQRYTRGEPVGHPIALHIGEWPALKDQFGDEVCAPMRRLLREAPKTQIIVSLDAQDAQVQTLGLGSGLRNVFWTKVIGNVDEYSWRGLTDEPYRKMPARSWFVPGRGVVAFPQAIERAAELARPTPAPTERLAAPATPDRTPPPGMTPDNGYCLHNAIGHLIGRDPQIGSWPRIEESAGIAQRLGLEWLKGEACRPALEAGGEMVVIYATGDKCAHAELTKEPIALLMAQGWPAVLGVFRKPPTAPPDDLLASLLALPADVRAAVPAISPERAARLAALTRQGGITASESHNTALSIAPQQDTDTDTARGITVDTSPGGRVVVNVAQVVGRHTPRRQGAGLAMRGRRDRLGRYGEVKALVKAGKGTNEIVRIVRRNRNDVADEVRRAKAELGRG